MKMKLAYFTNLAVPHSIKLCEALQPYINTKFYFYDKIGNRASWWQTEPGPNSELLKDVYFKKYGRYFSFDVIKQLRNFNPDIVMLGGFSIPGNFLAYCWARLKGKKTIVFTERSRTKKGVLRKYTLTWKFIRFLYRNVDQVIVSADDIVDQFKNTFKFGERVVAGRYASNIDSYFNHPMRTAKASYNIIFPNRLVEYYNPIGALEVFYELNKYSEPKHKLYMNAMGEQRQLCEEKIIELGLDESVSFLDDISSWDDLAEIYKNMDIMFLPAKFSNGNFTIMEAMASGMGIIISDKILGVGNLIENGHNGFRCKCEKDDFINAFRNYIKKTELFKQHAKINRSIVEPLGILGTAQFMATLILDRK